MGVDLQTEQHGINFQAKVEWQKSITAVDTTGDTVTFDDEDHALGDILSEGDTFDISGSTGNDGTYTIATGGIDTSTTDKTTLSTDESIGDSTADGEVHKEDPIGKTTSATRTKSTDNEEVTNRDSGRWAERMGLTKSVDYEFDAFKLEGSSYQTGLGIKIEVADGQGGFNELQAVEEAGVSLSMDLVEFSNNDSNRWRNVKPNTRDIEVTLDRDHIDRETDTAADDLLNAQENGNNINVKITLGSFILDATFRVTETGHEMPFDDLAGTPLTLALDDTAPSITHSGDDQGLRSLLAAFLANAPQPLQAKTVVLDEDGNLVTEATSYEMEAFPSSIDFTFPVEGASDVSGTLVNNGAETASVQ